MEGLLRLGGFYYIVIVTCGGRRPFTIIKLQGGLLQEAEVQKHFLIFFLTVED